MNPIESFTKTLRRDQLIIGLVTAAVYFAAVALGIAIEVKLVGSQAKVFLPLMYCMGVVGSTQTFLIVRMQGALQAVAKATNTASK